MANDGETICDQVFAINQTWKLKIAFELGILNDVERGRVLADFNEYFIIRKVEIEEKVSDGLGHTSEVVVDESKVILMGFIFHLLWNDKN
jgi:hypothetical protein